LDITDNDWTVDDKLYLGTYDPWSIRLQALVKWLDAPVQTKDNSLYAKLWVPDVIPSLTGKQLLLQDPEIIERYIYERYPGRPLLPQDVKTRAQCFQLAKEFSNLYELNYPSQLMWVNQNFEKRGRFILGDEPSLVDLSAFPIFDAIRLRIYESATQELLQLNKIIRQYTYNVTREFIPEVYEKEAV